MKRATRWLHTIHRWTGLISGINVLILSLTGAYLVFSEEIHHAFEAAPGAVVATVDPAGANPIQASFDVLQPMHPDAKPFRVFPLREDGESGYMVMFNESGVYHRYVLDPETGAVRPFHESTADKVNAFILSLHANLFLGMLGTAILGVVALFFFTSTVTGMVIYAPFMKQAAYGVFRRDKGVRKASADFHKLIGVSSLGFNLVIAVTSVALTFGMIGVQYWSLGTVRAMAMASNVPEAGELPPADEVLAAAQAVHPDAPVNSVAYPGGFQGKDHYLVFHESTGKVRQYIPILSLVPVAKPELAQSLTMPMWVQAIMVCFPLHFGNYGGLALKVVYCLFGISAGALTLTGALLTVIRWRRKLRARVRRRAPAGQPASQPLPGRAEL